MSRDTTYQIKVTISSGKAAEIEKFLNEALPENSPTERKTIVVYEHFRKLGPECAEQYNKDVQEILQEAAAAFPGASIEMQWSDEFGQEGGSFYASKSMRQETPSDDHKEEPDYIDLKVVQKFLDNPYTEYLSSAKGISDNAAQALAEHKGPLPLWCLTELSDTAAQALAEHKGSLCLGGLTELSDTTVQTLARHKGSLCLNGLTELSDTAAQALAEHEGDLSLWGLTELSDTAAQALAEHKGDLSLWGLNKLSDAVAQALAKHEGDLSLGDLTELSDVAAQALAEHEGELSLDGLTQLSAAAAEAFSRKKGTINETDPAEWLELLQS
jgi:hypothetical protein